MGEDATEPANRADAIRRLICMLCSMDAKTSTHRRYSWSMRFASVLANNLAIIGFPLYWTCRLFGRFRPAYAFLDFEQTIWVPSDYRSKHKWWLEKYPKLVPKKPIDYFGLKIILRLLWSVLIAGVWMFLFFSHRHLFSGSKCNNIDNGSVSNCTRKYHNFGVASSSEGFMSIVFFQLLGLLASAKNLGNTRHDHDHFLTLREVWECDWMQDTPTGKILHTIEVMTENAKRNLRGSGFLTLGYGSVCLIFALVPILRRITRQGLRSGVFRVACQSIGWFDSDEEYSQIMHLQLLSVFVVLSNVYLAYSNMKVITSIMERTFTHYFRVHKRLLYFTRLSSYEKYIELCSNNLNINHGNREVSHREALRSMLHDAFSEYLPASLVPDREEETLAEYSLENRFINLQFVPDIKLWSRCRLQLESRCHEGISLTCLPLYLSHTSQPTNEP